MCRLDSSHDQAFASVTLLSLLYLVFASGKPSMSITCRLRRSLCARRKHKRNIQNVKVGQNTANHTYIKGQRLVQGSIKQGVELTRLQRLERLRNEWMPTNHLYSEKPKVTENWVIELGKHDLCFQEGEMSWILIMASIINMLVPSPLVSPVVMSHHDRHWQNSDYSLLQLPLIYIVHLNSICLSLLIRKSLKKWKFTSKDNMNYCSARVSQRLTDSKKKKKKAAILSTGKNSTTARPSVWDL